MAEQYWLKRGSWNLGSTLRMSGIEAHAVMDPAGEQAAAKGTVAEDGYIVGRAPAPDGAVDLAIEDVVGRLVRVERRNKAERRHLDDAEVAHTQRSHLPLALELAQQSGNFGDGSARIRPVNLVEIDIVGAQAAKAAFKLQAKAVGGRVGEDAALVPFQAGLGGDVKVLAAAKETHSPADDLLGASVAVDGRCVDEIDAALDGAEAGCDGHIVGNAAPVQPANLPGSQTDAGDFHACNCRCFHANHIKRSRTGGAPSR